MGEFSAVGGVSVVDAFTIIGISILEAIGVDTDGLGGKINAAGGRIMSTVGTVGRP